MTRMHPSIGRRVAGLLFGVWVAAASIAAQAPPRAQTAAEADLQAAFLLNFARFTEWPGLPPERPLVLCVFSDARVTRALTKALRGQTIDGRALHVYEVAADSDISACQLLFIGKASIGTGAPLLRSATGHPILTVSDREHFAATTGIIELFVENGRMRFAINVDEARRSQLTLSSRLLGLARVVRGKHAG